MSRFAYSQNGLNLTKYHEGCKLVAYQDVAGVWTIGYGHTGKDVVSGLTWTQQQANEALALDVSISVLSVNSLVKVVITQNQFDALVDFEFNLGIGSLKHSTLLVDLNNGKIQAAANEFPRWCHANGKVSNGLLERRIAERTLFLSD